MKRILRSIGLWIYALVALAVIGFLGLVAWNLLANFWALGIGGMAIVALVIFTLYNLGSEDDDDPKMVERAKVAGLVGAPRTEREQLVHRMTRVLDTERERNRDL